MHDPYLPALLMPALRIIFKRTRTISKEGRVDFSLYSVPLHGELGDLTWPPTVLMVAAHVRVWRDGERLLQIWSVHQRCIVCSIASV